MSRESSNSRGFDTLFNVHLQALEDNSEAIVEILEELSNKGLSLKERNSLKKITKDLKGIDKKVDSLGELREEEEDDWYEF